jgi:hypothetical protein
MGQAENENPGPGMGQAENENPGPGMGQAENENTGPGMGRLSHASAWIFIFRLSHARTWIFIPINTYKLSLMMRACSWFPHISKMSTLTFNLIISVVVKKGQY